MGGFFNLGLLLGHTRTNYLSWIFDMQVIIEGDVSCYLKV